MLYTSYKYMFISTVMFSLPVNMSSSEHMYYLVHLPVPSLRTKKSYSEKHFIFFQKNVKTMSASKKFSKKILNFKVYILRN